MKPWFLTFAALIAVPALAQQSPQPAASAPAALAPPAEEGGLSGEVSDESEWQDLGIAIPAFATRLAAWPATGVDATGERVAVAATRLAEDLEREYRAGIPINADERAAAIATWLLSSSPP